MTNDAKLGMLAGVIGVVVASVFFAKQPAQPVAAEPAARPALAAQVPAPVSTPAVPASLAPGVQPDAAHATYSSTPVARTRKEVDARPASRQPAVDEEP